MSLKDLIASKASLAEDVIEEIISDFVRYDPDARAVAFTLEAHGLPNRSKVLVYLVALQGWPFVLDEVVPVDAKPSEIEEGTGIPGGTLRPLLKELKDRNVIAEKGGRYFVRAAALRTIKTDLSETPSSSPTRRIKRKPKDGTPDRERSSEEVRATSQNERRTRRSSSSSGAGEQFSSWFGEGFFDQPRTLADVQKRFHKEGVIVPQTSIPSYLLAAIRSKRLERDKQQVNGKLVWVYTKKR